MSIDVNQERGTFIGKIKSRMKEFHFASPHVLVNLMISYAYNINGSNPWDFFSQDCQRFCNSYNVAVQNIISLPRQTQRYLLKPLTDTTHLNVQLLAFKCCLSSSILSNTFYQRHENYIWKNHD